jgi:2-polyprenyl-3-methyl-5-hydroxy-6-metoxy-1,4-benzoquinol methylase
MNILILIIVFVILTYLSKINKNKKKIIKDCPECKKYRKFTKMRLIHLNSLNFNFHNKTVLEIGAKDTSFARFFISEKAKVTISSPLDSKIKKFKKSKLDLEIIKLDIENPVNIPKFDFIICYGVIEHISNPIKSIEWMSKNCNTLILETSVSNLLSHNIMSINYKKNGSRFSRLTIMNLLKNFYKYVYTTKTQPENEKYPKYWNSIDPKYHLSLNIRAIFVASHSILDNNTLQFNLPNIQK